MELTPEVNDLYRKLVNELQKFGKITVEEKKTSFHIKAGQPLPECIPANSISFLILFPPRRSRVPGWVEQGQVSAHRFHNR